MGACRRLGCLLLLGVMCTYAYAVEYSIIVEGIARPVTMTFPDGFLLADSDQARLRRERLLAFYRQNPRLRGQYDEILLPDWSSAARYPVIVVGTLGSTARQQGRISRSYWLDIRRTLLALTPSNIKMIRDDYRPRMEEGSPVETETTEELVWLEEQTDPDSAVVLAHLRSQVDGTLEATFSARKIMFHSGYVLFVNIHLDSSSPGALSTIRSFLDALKIVSI